MMESSYFSNNNMKRSKKPKPLFGIFRAKTNKQEPSALGSGISSVPLQSVLSPTTHRTDPYTPTIVPKPSMSDTRSPLFSPQFPPKQQQKRRPRSKSVGRDPSSINHRLLNEREMALNKLCQKEVDNNPQSLADSIALLSPTQSALPPVPPIPLEHQQGMRKFSSAHDLRKAAKLQQESISQALDKLPPPPPMPKTHLKVDLSRSKSLNSSYNRLQPSKSHQQLNSKFAKCPNTATAATFPKFIHDDDDDIPLGYLQSPISKPSSLLSDNNDDDDDIDLIPIAKLNQQLTEVNASTNNNNEEYLTAADKYKEKVKERLQLDNDDDDDIPISLSLSKKHNNKK